MHFEPSGTLPRVPRDLQRAIPRFLDNAGSWGSGTHCPRRWRGQLQRQQGSSYPEGAELRAVGPGGGWNPSGAAGLRSPWAAGLGSCCWRDRVGSARLGSPWRSRRSAPRRSVSGGGWLGARGSFRAPRRLQRRRRSRPGASCRGIAAGAQAAADHAIPQPPTRAHLCRDKG